MRKVLLATKFTMEDGYYAPKLERFGLTVSIPQPTEREDIRAIQSELARGRMEPRYREHFDALRRYAALDAARAGLHRAAASDRTVRLTSADPQSDTHPVRSGVPVCDRVSAAHTLRHDGTLMTTALTCAGPPRWKPISRAATSDKSSTLGHPLSVRYASCGGWPCCR
jgi:hypothetical protein